MSRKNVGGQPASFHGDVEGPINTSSTAAGRDVRTTSHEESQASSRIGTLRVDIGGVNVFLDSTTGQSRDGSAGAQSVTTQKSRGQTLLPLAIPSENHKIDELQSIISALKTENNELRAENNELQSKLRASKAENTKLRKDHATKTTFFKDQLKQARSCAEQEANLATERERQRQKIWTTFDDSVIKFNEAEMTELQETNSKQAEEIAVLTEKVSRLEKHLKVAAHYKAKARKLEDKLQSAESRLWALEEQGAPAAANKAALAAEQKQRDEDNRAALLTEKKDLKVEIKKQKEEEEEEHVAAINDCNDKIKMDRQKLQTCKQGSLRLKSLQDSIARSETERKGVQEKLDKVRLSINQMEARIREIDEELDEISDVFSDSPSRGPSTATRTHSSSVSSRRGSDPPSLTFTDTGSASTSGPADGSPLGRPRVLLDGYSDKASGLDDHPGLDDNVWLDSG